MDALPSRATDWLCEYCPSLDWDDIAEVKSKLGIAAAEYCPSLDWEDAAEVKSKLGIAGVKKHVDGTQLQEEES